MEKKPVYESPKVSKLDEKEALHGQGAPCIDGSGATTGGGCDLGNLASPQCSGGSGVIRA